jgi:hypothetical protein
MSDATSVDAMDENEPSDDIFDGADAASIEATGYEDPEDSDSSVEYENFGGCVNQDTIVSEEGEPDAIYTGVSFFDTEAEAEAEQALHRLNEFVYSYKTRYISRFRVGKEFSCHSHNGCRHYIKLVTHHAGDESAKFEVQQKGSHVGALVNVLPKGISPVLKPEIDALLHLGMGAGRIRNMLLFKYLRNPKMMSLISEVKKMANRKSLLKTNVTGRKLTSSSRFGTGLRARCASLAMISSHSTKPM